MVQHVLTYSTLVDAPTEEVWAAIGDFGNVAKVNPNVSNSYLTSDATDGVGATRHCDLSLYGASVEERITEWVDGEKLAIDVYDSNRLPIIEDSTAMMRVDAVGEKTRLTSSLSYSVKYGPVGAVMNRLMLRGQFATAMKRFLAGIKHHVETGALIDRSTPVPVSAVSEAGGSLNAGVEGALRALGCCDRSLIGNRPGVRPFPRRHRLRRGCCCPAWGSSPRPGRRTHR